MLTSSAEAIWKVALNSGARVLALNIIEAAASSEKAVRRRNELNAMIAKHEETRHGFKTPDAPQKPMRTPFLFDFASLVLM